MRKLLIILFLLAQPSFAEQPAKCVQDNVGTLTCMAGKQCECVYEAGGTMTGKPSGYRWDCGLNRPNCMDNSANQPVPYDGPDSVLIDKSTVEIK